MKIYLIDSSARKKGSTSRLLAKKLLEKIRKPIATNRNLNANAEKGSLLLIIGFVVTNAEDQRTMNIIGKSLTIRINKLSCFI